MFERSELWMLSEPGVARIEAEARRFWEGEGYRVDIPEPGHLRALRASLAFQLIRTVEIDIRAAGDGCSLRLRYHLGWAEPDAAQLPRPVARSNVSPPVKTAAEICEEDWQQERRAFWDHLVSTLVAGPPNTAALPAG